MKLKLLNILIIFFASLSHSYAQFFSLKERKYKKKCIEAQGQYQKKSRCYCKTSKNSMTGINPFERNCESLKSLQEKVPSNNLKCTLPSAWYCSEKTNKYFSNSFQKKKEKFEIEKRILKKKYPKTYLSVLKNKIYSELKFNAIRKVFNKTKKDFIDFVQNENLKQTDKIRIIEVISAATLKYGGGKYDGFDFNTFVRDEAIYIQGHIELYEENDFLYLMLLHELSHMIDPCSWNAYDNEYTTHPYQKTLQCLHSRAAINAKKYDISCFRRFIDNRKVKGEKIPYVLNLNFFEKIEKGSVCGYKTIHFSELKKDEKNCHVSQINESFSDWLATEIYMSYLKKLTTVGREKSISNSIAFLCSSTTSLESLKIEAYLESESFGSHPGHLDRINGLILNHPIIREFNHCVKNGKNIKADLRKLKNTEEIKSYSGYANYCEKE